jgi:RNA polymerase sigma factor (sigma-70 family)
MANRQTEGVLHGLCKLVAAHVAELTDGELLERFVGERDEAAFAALLQRHGALVYRVCRNILRHEQDVEDAFQATFLVLAQRASRVCEGKALSAWLYRVAYRVAMKARQAAARRREQERKTAKPCDTRPSCDVSWRELQAILDEELDRLPEKYRLPFVLCCLTGLSKSEAAAELQWKEGTVSSRLAYARHLLQSRLLRRGVSLSAILSGLAVARNDVSAAVPAALVATTQRSAVAFAAGESTTSAIPPLLARSVVRGMTLARAKIPAVILVVLGALGSAAAVFFRTQTAPNPPEPPNPSREVAVAPAPRPTGPEQAPVRAMTVSGSVVGPDGKALSGARVAVVANLRSRSGARLPLMPGPKLLGEGQADDQGRFKLAVPQTTHAHFLLTVLASAPGFAPSTHTADPQTITAPEHDLPVQLIRGLTVRGRLVDPAGKPASGVQVHVLGMERTVPPYVSIVYHEPPVPLPGWPDQIVTDAAGNFTIRDVGPDTKLLLQVRDERFATEWLDLRAGKVERAEPTVLRLSPPRVMEGRILTADTRQPLADATVAVETMLPVQIPSYGAFTGVVTTRTDSNGRYKLRPFPGERLEMWVHPPTGQPYLVLKQEMTWPKGNTPTLTADVTVPPGILVRGRAEEAGSGKPVVGAEVSYRWGYRRNPFWDASLARHGTEWYTQFVATAPDGSFVMAVPPGPGMLFVKAAEPDYVHVEVASGEVDGGKGGTPLFPDAFLQLNLKPMDPPQQPTLRLHRGVTVRGRVVGPNGKPVASAVLLAPVYVPAEMDMRGYGLPVRDGWFELPGCEPGKPVKVWVYDADGNHGAFAEFTAAAGTMPEVRLTPCSSAKVRIVDATGKPAAGTRLSLDLVLRPGDDINTSMLKGTTAGLTLWVPAVCGRSYRPLETAAGQFTLPSLIPGATYSLRADGAGGSSERITFIAPPAGSLDLGLLSLAARKR